MQYLIFSKTQHLYLDIRNSFGNDITERTTGKTSHLVHYKEHFPIFFGEEKSTAHEQLTRELAQHAVPQGTKAIRPMQHKLELACHAYSFMLLVST
uniref:Uncharacterized protein n=1 Tax=Anas zonorhyncha TaxID=75864 RepID=A0A8B9ZNS4_9AVES